MENKDYSKDLSEIRELMSRSSQFISLSGLSGILAGVYALIGAFVAKFFIFKTDTNFVSSVQEDGSLYLIILDLAVVLILSVTTAMVLSRNRAKDNRETFWGETTKRLVLNFLIPFITGAFVIFIFLNQGYYVFLPAFMLIFYGLALVNASKYTVGTIKYLGIAEIITGLICLALPAWGFWFWVIGFGLLHIVYGGVLYSEQKRP